MFTEYESKSHKIKIRQQQKCTSTVLLFSISKCLKQSKNTFTTVHTVCFLFFFVFFLLPILCHKYRRNPMVLHLLLTHSSFFFYLFLVSSFLRSPFVFLFRHVYLVFVLNTQNFTFQICSHDQKCNGILLTVF